VPSTISNGRGVNSRERTRILTDIEEEKKLKRMVENRKKISEKKLSPSFQRKQET